MFGRTASVKRVRGRPLFTCDFGNYVDTFCWNAKQIASKIILKCSNCTTKDNSSCSPIRLMFICLVVRR